MGSLSRKIIQLFFLLFLAFVIHLQTALADTARKDTPPARLAMVSAAEMDYPPFSVVDRNGLADGFSVELLRACLAAMGRDVTFRTGPWEEVKEWLRRGEVEALPLVGRTPDREKIFDFTFPYMSLYGAIVVRGDESGIKGLKDLAGKRVEVMKADNAEEFLRREKPDLKFTSTLTFKNALLDLSAGRCDAVVIQRLVALRLIKENGFTNLTVINRPVEGFRQDFCFAVKKGDAKTLAILNEGLSLVIADGTYQHLHSKWFAALELPTHRRIIVGGDQDYPPFEYMDSDGHPAGYNIDLVRAVAQEMGLDIEIRLGPWAKIREALASGEVDLLGGMFYSPARGREFDFSPPHTVNHNVCVVRAGGAPPPSSVAELAGKRLVVERGDIMHDWALENGLGKNLTAVASQEIALKELSAGKYDCALVARVSALYQIKRNGLKNLVVGKVSLLSQDYCFAVKKGNRALLAQFAEGLKAIGETGAYRRIYGKWMGVYEDSSAKLSFVMKWVGITAIPLFLCLLAILSWVWSLKRLVARRTAEVRKSERLLSTIIDSLATPVFYKNMDGVYVRCNRGFASFFGFSKDELIGKSAYDVAPRDLADVYRNADFALVESGKPITYDAVAVNVDGELRQFMVNKALNVGPDGRPEGIVGAMLDITDRKQAEMRIEHLNRVLLSIRDINQLILKEHDPGNLIREGCDLLLINRGYVSSIIVLTDENGRMTQFAASGLGAGAGMVAERLESGHLLPCFSKVTASEPLLVVEDHDAVCSDCPIRGALTQSPSLCIRLTHEGRLYGFLAVALDSGMMVDEEERSLFSEMAGDIAYALHVHKMEQAGEDSEKRRLVLEEQLIQAQKMESVGRLAGGVAHDFNNQLSVIIGHAELAMSKLADSSPVFEDLAEIKEAAGRSAELTKQLLAFARKQTIIPKVLDLNRTVEGMLKMLRRLIGEDVKLEWRPGYPLDPVLMDPVQLDQILANLCVNARDAINGVGKLTIETERSIIDEDYCVERAGAVPGRYTVIKVSDNGAGMDRETLARVFEPFFTTKGVGKGTGLGLSMVYGIVKQNKGFLEVESEAGVGTSFKIYLPGHQSGEAREQKASPADTGTGRGETILLVEDEIPILNIARRILTNKGYNLMVAGSPREALEFARVFTGSVNLLITDVVMPDMNGKDLAEQLKKRFPGMRVLFMSGYTADVIAVRGVLDNGVNFIQKPFSIKELTVKVRAALDSAV